MAEADWLIDLPSSRVCVQSVRFPPVLKRSFETQYN